MGLIGEVVGYHQVTQSAVSDLELVVLQVVQDLVPFDPFQDQCLLVVFILYQLDVLTHDDLHDGLFEALLIEVHHLIATLDWTVVEVLFGGDLLERRCVLDDDVLGG
mmetsp:Transcript_9759/g.9538  ORF Transcript_9759/g.9538 Transcript_9759/m.9538 type:complete len:107 (-) Transcript_9759:631-951(-)